ncbi:hypothetical protein MHM84_18565 [Halomonas sp. McH1-25]|uniref:hypothetical protein n=1 Tax=unclassified Halomonas TaxID=2609666 RepID=UPI001EF735AB|nr:MULTISPECIES: hypothetical protein [unclassified Halomonas]MCG7601770.1 hypothetical protein [Halomonas sp. McH1-25]MCP1344633.1 hypothetical protein [Halomonas sp. FL8]MCP1363116.1 hypothetical protein [Halomonas sp. BBD45]MCP1365110.1 hypothetical protein [Halomonas sp. BBD48]
MSNFFTYQLTAGDMNVILAGLRLLERTSGWDIPDEIQEIGGESLDVVNIGRLCQHLNLNGQPVLSQPERTPEAESADLVTALGNGGWPTALWNHSALPSGRRAVNRDIPRLTLVGFAANSEDVIVANEREPEDSLEIGYRDGVWSVYRRDPLSGEAHWLADREEIRWALEFCATWLRVELTNEVAKAVADKLFSSCC